MRKWVMGDIHGEYYKLKRILEEIDFDYDNDLLIQLGDVVDRGNFSFECVEELLKINNKICIKGNHDNEWFLSYKNTTRNSLVGQGGHNTDMSYIKNSPDPSSVLGFVLPEEHYEFFEKQVPYYIDEDNNCFVHGGFNPNILIEDQKESFLLWDRDLLMAAIQNGKEKPFKTRNNFKKIFLGHTPTIYWTFEEDENVDNKIIIPKGEPITVPMIFNNVYNMDTGCGKGNFPLSVINLDDGNIHQVN